VRTRAEPRARDEQRQHVERGVGPREHAIAVADPQARERRGDAIRGAVELPVGQDARAERGRGGIRHHFRVAPHDVADQDVHARQHARARSRRKDA
jgi:hypothetical protein